MKKTPAVFAYVINPRAFGLDKDPVFICRPTSGELKDSDTTYKPDLHELLNYDDFERARDYNDTNLPYFLP